ncbi:hypothetical protein Hdeb2414_s0025g00663501 [Helianthus debilis subsp. tardiflorus]
MIKRDKDTSKTCLMKEPATILISHFVSIALDTCQFRDEISFKLGMM